MLNDKLLDHYNRELAYLHELGAEFAANHPKIAGRLGMRGMDTADPYVERLLEGFAFLTARIQLKMDAEFPRFSQRLLETLYPNYLAPTPSMAIAELIPDSRKGDISGGYRVPRGTLMESVTLKQQGITCSYVTGHDVVLQPLELLHVELGGIPAGLPLAALGVDASVCRSALRMRFKVSSQALMSELKLERLALHLSGPDMLAQQLLELLMQHTLGVVGQIKGASPQSIFLPADALRHDGFENDEALLPNDLRGFDTYRLLQEYFAFPARFLFFSIHGLSPLFENYVEPAGKKPEEFEVMVILDHYDENLAILVDVRHLALHCTPIVNLYPKTADRITLDEKTSEYHVVVDRVKPLDHEIFSVQRLSASSNEQRKAQDFRPFYHTQYSDHADFGAYFSVRREPRLASAQGRRFGPRTAYAGSEIFVSLVDQQHAPWHSELKYMMAEVLCTNRDLPLLLQGQENGGFAVAGSFPILDARLRRNPTPPRPALAEDLITWGLISQLQINYLSLMEKNGEEGARSLRQLLSLYANLSEPAVVRQIEGIRDCRLRPIHRKSAAPGPAMFARGVAIDLTVDEQAFSGATPYLFGSVLEHLFSRLVTINSFVETTLHSKQRGDIAFWAPRTGGKALI